MAQEKRIWMLPVPKIVQGGGGGGFKIPDHSFHENSNIFIIYGTTANFQSLKYISIVIIRNNANRVKTCVNSVLGKRNRLGHLEGMPGKKSFLLRKALKV